MTSPLLSRRQFAKLSGACSLLPHCTSLGDWLGLTQASIRPELFGAASAATRDGDDTAALQAAFDALGTDGDEIQLSRTYRISRRIAVSGKKNFRVTGGGAIVASAAMPVASGYQCLFLEDCSDFEIEDITIDGNRTDRAAREVAAHAVELRSCRRFALRGVRITNSVTDCLYLSSANADRGNRARHSHQADFIDCEFDRGFRQGVSIIQGNHLRFTRCRFANTQGTAPQAGIDLESNAEDLPGAIHDISFEECTFEGNAGYGLLVGSAHTPVGITASRCTFKDNGAGAVSFNGRRGELSDCVFSGFPAAAALRGCIDVGASAGAGDLEVRRARFVDMGRQGPDHYLLYVHRASGGRVRLIDTYDSAAPYIAALRAAGCEVIGGRFAGAAPAAIALLGDRCAARGASFAGSAGEVIRIAGKGCEVSACSFEDRTGTGRGGAIRVLEGASVAITNNRFRGSARGGAAISIARVAAVDLSGNTYSGYAALSERE